MRGKGYRAQRDRARRTAIRLFGDDEYVVKAYVDGERVYLSPERPNDFAMRWIEWDEFGRVVVCDDVPDAVLNEVLEKIRRAGRCTSPFIRKLPKEVI